MSADLFIVITDFNGSRQTCRCLRALADSENQEFVVVVVDHGTDGRTGKMMLEDYPEHVRLQGSPDLWWTAASNMGIRYAIDHNADWIMLLNNDCFVRKGTIGKLLDLSQTEESSIIAPVQYDLETGNVTSFNPSSGLTFGFSTLPGLQGKIDFSGYGALHAVKLIVGGRGVIIPSTVFNRIGMFDEADLPHYGADHDFYLRARGAGIKLFTACQAAVDIDNSTTTLSKKLDLMEWAGFLRSLTDRRSHRNFHDNLTLFKKHYPLKYFYLTGVFLYYSRYILVYFFSRLKKVFMS